MAVQLDGGGKEDLKTQFVTREGTYKLMTLSEYSRPNRVGYTNSQGSASVRVSFVTLPDPADPTGAQGLGDRMCFNFGKELYVYVYRGVKKVRRDPATATVTRDASGVLPVREPSSRPNLANVGTSIFAVGSVSPCPVHRDDERDVESFLWGRLASNRCYLSSSFSFSYSRMTERADGEHALTFLGSVSSNCINSIADETAISIPSIH